MDINEVLVNLGIGSPEFFAFMDGKIKVFPYQKDFPWGCFPIVSAEGILEDIRLLVPECTSEFATRIAIHEYAHAYDLYQILNNEYYANYEQREEYAKGKENAYLMLIKKEKENK